MLDTIPMIIESTEPPCEMKSGCSMGGYCQASGDNCRQFSNWQATGKIDFSMSRVPHGLAKKEVEKKYTAGRPRHEKDHKLLIKQLRVKQWLAQLNAQSLMDLSELMGVKYATLKNNRLIHSGLSKSFIDKMHKQSVQAFLAAHIEDMQVAA